MINYCFVLFIIYAEEERRHLTACEEAIRKNGKVDLKCGIFLLNGGPRVGKSTFLSRITGRQLPHSDDTSETPSTGVADRVLQVVIKKSSMTVARALKPGMNWQVVTLSEEAVTSLKAISRCYQQLQQPDSQVQPISPPSSASTSGESTSKVDTSTASERITTAETGRQPLAEGTSGTGRSRLGFFNFGQKRKSSSRIPGYKLPLEFFQEALRSKAWASAAERLEESLNLYFNDVGGQPEFQEVLPAIIAGPSVFFILFKLSDSLHQRYRVHYVDYSSNKTITYESSFTVFESIFQSLASIFSTCSFISRSSRELVPIKPKVFLVGTHKDRVDDKRIRDIQRELKDALATTDFHKEGMLVFASPNEPALTINSCSDNEEDASKIRQFVEKIIEKDPAFKVSVPAAWLALSLSLRLLESSVISFDDCRAFASDCAIDTDEEIKEALWFLHTKLGVIRYFHQIPELSDIVICDPQVLFDKITSLITRTFTFEETQDAYTSVEFQQKGIFPARVIDEISGGSNNLLTTSKLITLLKHLRIIAEIYDEQSEVPSRYLIPSVLSHAPQPSKALTPSSEEKKMPTVVRKVASFFKKRTSEPIAESIPPLCILFRCGYCPKGMFGALVADLMNRSTGLCRWRLIDGAIFRDQVQFKVGQVHHVVTISLQLTFLEINVSAETDHAKSLQEKNPKVVCNDIRLEIQQSLINVSKTLHYGSEAGIYFGFHCTSCPGSTPAHCDDEDPVVMSCKTCNKSIDLVENQRYWFGQKFSNADVLNVEHLTAVRSKVWDARAKWYDIGLELGIDPGTLDAIKSNNDNVEDRLREMLRKWLNKIDPPPTNSQLAKALESRSVGYCHLAEQISSSL